jgi:hypothetical protein
MLTKLIAAAPDPSIVGPGRAAFAVVAVLAVATVLLFLSMTRHIKRVPPTFPDSSRPAPPPGDQPE